MSEQKLKRYQEYTLKLAREVETVYGKLNIIKLVESIIPADHFK